MNSIGLSGKRSREMNRRWIGADFETSIMGDNEPPFPLPSWEEYRESLLPVNGDDNV